MIGAAVAAVGGAAFFLGGVRFAACAKDACIAACADADLVRLRRAESEMVTLLRQRTELQKRVQQLEDAQGVCISGTRPQS